MNAWINDFFCLGISCPRISSTDLVRDVKEKEGNESLCDLSSCMDFDPWENRYVYHYGESWIQRLWCVCKGKKTINGTEKKMEMSLCAYQELLKIGAIWEELWIPWDRLTDWNILSPLVVHEAYSIKQPTGQPFCQWVNQFKWLSGGMWWM